MMKSQGRMLMDLDRATLDSGSLNSALFKGLMDLLGSFREGLKAHLLLTGLVGRYPLDKPALTGTSAALK